MSTHAESCRALIARARTATLSTLAQDPAGYPFGSLVAVAFDDEGRGLMMLSKLAEHTTNLAQHEEASLLVHAPIGEGEDPLMVERMTIVGRVRPLEENAAEAARARYVAAHPSASRYAGFSDFRMYALEPLRVRYVGGFGRMSWLDGAALGSSR